MSWLEQMVKRLDPEKIQLVNDSKTPSGRVHVGSLRGPLIHDCVTAFLKLKGFSVKYLYGVDDFDPLDELPLGQEEFYQEYLGQPLCNVPAPKGSPFSDIAKHYIAEFFNVFEELNIKPERYYLRDYYRSGKFNESIDLFLKNADKIREINFSKSGAKRASNWHPFQPICEECGKVGTTEVSAYDGKEVEYHCREDLVKWAEGCGYCGKVSPFDGKGKLPWKFEWAAKWKALGVTIEGAGSDHCTRGGSRDVTNACYEALYNEDPPLNIPYEFFMVGGAKMSSSKGIGSSARSMADFLSPSLLRYLMLRTKPNRTVDFRTDQMFMNRLFDDFDKLKQKYFSEKVNDVEKFVYEISQVSSSDAFTPISFSLATSLIQLPHVDIVEQVEEIEDRKLAPTELELLNQRIHSAKIWLQQYASKEEMLVLQNTLPSSSNHLSVAQKAFLNQLGKALKNCPWQQDTIQIQIFDTARLTPLDQPKAFAAIYNVLFDKESGPKAGNLIAFMERDFIIERFLSLPYDKDELIKETSTTIIEFEEWLTKNHGNLCHINAHQTLLQVFPSCNGSSIDNQAEGILEFTVITKAQKKILKRVNPDKFNTSDKSEPNHQEIFKKQPEQYLKDLSNRMDLPIKICFG